MSRTRNGGEESPEVDDREKRSYQNGSDSSVHIGPRSSINNSAVGAGARVVTINRTAAFTVGAFLFAALAGWVANIFTGWAPKLLHFITGGK